jgi:hypothetical protein
LSLLVGTAALVCVVSPAQAADKKPNILVIWGDDIVGFEFTGDALFEIDRFRRKEGREIKPLTVREILDEEIATT